MALIDFTPGLQALGKMFEDKTKMDIDLFERQKKLDEENKILKFNQLAGVSLSNVTDEKDLLDKTNLLTAYANENGILDKVSTNINSLAGLKSKQLAYIEEDKNLSALISEVSEKGGYKEYNNQIMHSKDIISNMINSGISKKIALDMYSKLEEAKLSQTVINEGGKYVYSENFRTKGAESKGQSRNIISKNNKLYWEDTEEEINSPYIKDAYYKEKERVIANYEKSLMSRGSSTKDNSSYLPEGIQAPKSEGEVVNYGVNALRKLQERMEATDKFDSWTIRDPNNLMTFDEYEDEYTGDIDKKATMIENFDPRDITTISSLMNNVNSTLDNYYIFRKINGKPNKFNFRDIVEEFNGWIPEENRFDNEKQIQKKYKIREGKEMEMFRELALTLKNANFVLKDKNPVDIKKM